MTPPVRKYGGPPVRANHSASSWVKKLSQAEYPKLASENHVIFA